MSAAPPRTEARPASSGDPSAPRSTKDFELAAGPYKDSFAALGLTPGAGPSGERAILRSDGTPASPEDLSLLGTLIASEPTALVRNPAFFDPSRGGIERSRFTDLKETYRDLPETRGEDFKDIALQVSRDFRRSESCDKISGKCNKHADKSYKKGEDVPPRDLNGIWGAVKGYLAAKRSRDARRMMASRVAFRSKTFNALTGADEEPGEEGDEGGARLRGLRRPRRGPQGVEGHARGGSAGGPAASEPRSGMEPGAPTQSPGRQGTASRRSLLWIALAAAAIALLCAVLWRAGRRRQDRGDDS